MSNMHWEVPDADPAQLGPYTIDIRMLAVRDHVSGLRALVADWALRENHDLDFVDDVRLAMDEVCSIMMANCTAEDVLHLRLMVCPERVEITAWARLAPGVEPAVGGLSLSVLRALAENLEHRVEDTEQGGVLRLSFSRTPVAGFA